jgi:hypothetical protein
VRVEDVYTPRAGPRTRRHGTTSARRLSLRRAAVHGLRSRRTHVELLPIHSRCLAGRMGRHGRHTLSPANGRFMVFLRECRGFNGKEMRFGNQAKATIGWL